MGHRLVVALLTLTALLVLAGCAGGTEAARLDAKDSGGGARPRPTGVVTPGEMPPLGAPVTCQTAPDQLTRDWNRTLVARGRDYFGERLAQLTRDIDALSQLGATCPGNPAAPGLVAAAAALRASSAGVGSGDRAALQAVAAAGNRWLDARHSQRRFAPP